MDGLVFAISDRDVKVALVVLVVLVLLAILFGYFGRRGP
jgi:hypothetical protein